MRKGTGITSLADVDVGKRRAEAFLEEIGMIEHVDTRTLRLGSLIFTRCDVVVGVGLRCEVADFAIGVREAAQFKTSAGFRVAELGLVLGRVIGQLVLRVCEQAIVAIHAGFVLGPIRTFHVPVLHLNTVHSVVRDAATTLLRIMVPATAVITLLDIIALQTEDILDDPRIISCLLGGLPGGEIDLLNLIKRWRRHILT